ncbi:O-antigen polymerase [Priestia aryabhattai]
MAKKIGVFLFFIFFLNLVGSPYLVNFGFNEMILFNTFLIINGSICVSIWGNDLKKVILPLFFFTYWSIIMSLGIFRLGYLNIFDLQQVDQCLIVVIFSSILIYLGIALGKNFQVKSIKLLHDANISSITYYILLSMNLFFILIRFYFAGGVSEYLTSDYQAKVPTSLQTLFFILKTLLTNFDYLNLVFVIGNRKKVITKIARIYFCISILNIFASGGSTGILFLLLSLILLKLFMSKTRIEEKKISKKIVPVGVIGVIVGVLIRFNRTNYGEFNFNILGEAINKMIATATFDCLENYIKVTTQLSPKYIPEQLIYPFVNFLPRDVFPWKPLELGRVIADTYYNFGGGLIGGFAPSPMGEFYFDFGYFGIIVGMLAIGCFLGIMQKKINRSQYNVYTMCFLVTLVYWSSTIPNWYTGFAIRFIYMIIYFFIVVIIEGLLTNRKNK